jgi:hypothetical protein
MRALQSIAAAGLGAIGLLTATAGSAQVPPGFNSQRDCQTVRTCTFRRTSEVRGCLSSYTCRICRLVTARCTISGHEQSCREMRCSWGG